MSIDGARMIDEVDRRSWSTQAAEAGVSPRFLEQRARPFVDRVAATAVELAADPAFGDPIVERFVGGILDRAEKFR